MMMRRKRVGTMVAGAVALAASALALAAEGAALAQEPSNPADVRTPGSDGAFKLTFPNVGQQDAGGWSFNQSPAFELPSMGKWRFTLNLDDATEERFELDSFRASAFFDLTPRMSLGGKFSLSDEDGALARASGGQLADDVPEVKFESAFRF